MTEKCQATSLRLISEEGFSMSGILVPAARTEERQEAVCKSMIGCHAEEQEAADAGHDESKW